MTEEAHSGFQCHFHSCMLWWLQIGYKKMNRDSFCFFSTKQCFFMIFGMTQLFVILEWIFPEIHKKPRFIKKQNIHENRIHLHEYCFFSLLFIHLVSYSWKALPMGNILDCGVAVWPQPRIFIPIPSNLLKVKRWRILP